MVKAWADAFSFYGPKDKVIAAAPGRVGNAAVLETARKKIFTCAGYAAWLHFRTTEKKSYCRDDAPGVFQYIFNETGGIALDICGVVRAIVPGVSLLPVLKAVKTLLPDKKAIMEDVVRIAIRHGYGDAIEPLPVLGIKRALAEAVKDCEGTHGWGIEFEARKLEFHQEGNNLIYTYIHPWWTEPLSSVWTHSDAEPFPAEE